MKLVDGICRVCRFDKAVDPETGLCYECMKTANIEALWNALQHACADLFDERSARDLHGLPYRDEQIHEMAMKYAADCGAVPPEPRSPCCGVKCDPAVARARAKGAPWVAVAACRECGQYYPEKTLVDAVFGFDTSDENAVMEAMERLEKRAGKGDDR